MAYSQFGDLSARSQNSSSIDPKSLTILQRDEVTSIAKKYGKTPGQVCLRWAVQRGTCVMPKTEKVERLSENLDIFDFNLTQSEMEQIASLNQNIRYLDPGVFCEKNFGCFCPIYDWLIF